MEKLVFQFDNLERARAFSAVVRGVSETARPEIVRNLSRGFKVRCTLFVNEYREALKRWNA